MKSETCNLKPVAAAAVVSLIFTLLLYGGALTLPFYSDDLLQVPWVKETGLVEFWHTVGPYQDYRPLHFTLWRLLYLLAGDLRPGMLHGLNLAGHTACGAMVGLLAARWRRGDWAVASLAAALFAAFPFAFDAVPWAIGFSYPLTTGLALGALLVYLKARKRGSTALYLTSVVLVFLAGFSYEGGVATGPAILLAEWLLPGEGRRRPAWPLAHVAGSAIVLYVGALVRPQGTAFHGLAWPDLACNGAYALQALTFPAAPLAGVLARWGMNPSLAVALAGLPVLAAVGWAGRRTAGVGPLLLALGWWALWSLPPVLTLRFDWLKDAPRAFYPAAAGAALLWANGLNRGGRKVSLSAHAASLAAVAALCLAPACWFVVGRMALQRQVGGLLWEVVAAAEGEGPLLVVNLPGRITPPGRLYPLGHEGLIPMPARVGAEELVAAHTGERGRAFERAWGPVLPPLPYTVEPLGEPLNPDDLRRAGRVGLVVYRPDGMELEEAGAVLSRSMEGHPLATFGGSVSLLSVACVRAGPERVVVTAIWRLSEPVEGNPTVFAHLLGRGGELLAQADGDPLRGLYPFRLWPAGEVVRDVRSFEATATEAVEVRLGVWEPATGLRWNGVGPDGEPFPDNAFRYRECRKSGE